MREIPEECGKHKKEKERKCEYKEMIIKMTKGNDSLLAKQI
jgi:hypothetical protein